MRARMVYSASRSGAPRSNALRQSHGGMAERTKAAVLKTVVAVKSPWVRIPLPPPDRGWADGQFDRLNMERCQSGRLGLPAKQLWG